MPFKSKAQQRFMFSAESRGEIPKGTARRWAKHTKSFKDLPEHVKKAAFEDKVAHMLFEKVAQAPQFNYRPAATDSAMASGTQIYNKVRQSPAGGGLSAVGETIGQHPAQALPRAAANLTFLKSVQPFVPASDTGVFNQGIRTMQQGQRYVQDTVPTFRTKPFVGNAWAATRASGGAGMYWLKKGDADRSMGIARNLFPAQSAQHAAHVQKNLPPIPSDSTAAPIKKAAPSDSTIKR